MKFTWTKLEQFIQSLTEEQKNKPVTLVDFDGEVMALAAEAKICGESIYATFEGLLMDSDLSEDHGYNTEEIEELKDDSYLRIVTGEPYLLIG